MKIFLDNQRLKTTWLWVISLLFITSCGDSNLPGNRYQTTLSLEEPKPTLTLSIPTATGTLTPTVLPTNTLLYSASSTPELGQLEASIPSW